ncbi:MAG: hypothetical protein CM1200mP9_10430 [Gammaproteobacteria bacterium]|nr:MAG: hypothetical protein CM1200mP9_10430 [Gammaproteobacteria bacterium]
MNGVVWQCGESDSTSRCHRFHLYDRIEWALDTHAGLRSRILINVESGTRPGRVEPRTQQVVRRIILGDTIKQDPCRSAGYRCSLQTESDHGVDCWLHKGFTAPSNAEGVQEEEALNYEIGVRHQSDNRRVEVIGFLSDYDNLLGECTRPLGLTVR